MGKSAPLIKESIQPHWESRAELTMDATSDGENLARSYKSFLTVLRGRYLRAPGCHITIEQARLICKGSFPSRHRLLNHPRGFHSGEPLIEALEGHAESLVVDA